MPFLTAHSLERISACALGDTQIRRVAAHYLSQCDLLVTAQKQKPPVGGLTALAKTQGRLDS